jgi:hypothetical protein
MKIGFTKNLVLVVLVGVVVIIGKVVIEAVIVVIEADKDIVLHNGMITEIEIIVIIVLLSTKMDVKISQITIIDHLGLIGMVRFNTETIIAFRIALQTGFETIIIHQMPILTEQTTHPETIITIIAPTVTIIDQRDIFVDGANTTNTIRHC